MATYSDISYLHALSTTDSTTTSDSMQEQLQLSGFVTGRRYFVFARANIRSNSTDANRGVAVELFDYSNNQQVAGTYGLRHPRATSKNHNWSCFTVLTAGTGADHANGKSVGIRMAAETSGDTATIDDQVLTAIDITDLAEGVDYFYEENTTVTDTTTSYVTFANKALSLESHGSQDGSWLVAGYANIDINNTAGGNHAQVRLNAVHSATTDTPEALNDPEDDSEFVAGVLGRVYSLAYSTSSSATFNVQCKTAAFSLSPHEHKHSAIFGLRLSSFEDSSSTYSDAYQETGDTTYTDAATTIVEADGTTDYDYLVFGMSVFVGEATNRSVEYQINRSPSVGSDEDIYTSSSNADNTHSNGDELPFFLAMPSTVPSGSDDNTFALQFKKASRQDYGVKDAGIAVIKARLVSNAYVWDGSAGDGSLSTAANWTPTGVPGPRDRAIFNSGSVNCTTGGITVKSVHVAEGYSGAIGAGASFGFKRMNLSSPTATVKLTTRSSGLYLPGTSTAAKPTIYFTSGGLENEATKITAGTAGANCVSNGTETSIILDGDYWNNVVLQSQRQRYDCTINGNTTKLIVIGIPRVATKSTVTTAWVAGSGIVRIEDGSITNLYVDDRFANVLWMSDDTNGSVYLYNGTFDLSEASNAYSSAGLYVYGNARLNTKTGFGGFNSPTTFEWWASRSATWFMDDGQIVTPA